MNQESDVAFHEKYHGAAFGHCSVLVDSWTVKTVYFFLQPLGAVGDSAIELQMRDPYWIADGVVLFRRKLETKHMVWIVLGVELKKLDNTFDCFRVLGMQQVDPGPLERRCIDGDGRHCGVSGLWFLWVFQQSKQRRSRHL